MNAIQVFFAKVTKAIAGKSTVDEEVLDEVENALVSADVGIETTVKIIEQIEKRVAQDKYLNTAELNGILKQEIEKLLITNDSVMPAGCYAILTYNANNPSCPDSFISFF